MLNDDGANDAIQGDVKPGDKVVTDGQLRGRARARPVRITKGKAAPKQAIRAAMNISAPFIERPVMTVLLMAALVVVRPVRLFPAPGSASCPMWISPPSR